MKWIIGVVSFPPPQPEFLGFQSGSEKNFKNTAIESFLYLMVCWQRPSVDWQEGILLHVLGTRCIRIERKIRLDLSFIAISTAGLQPRLVLLLYYTDMGLYSMNG